jgi:hypothetical protein
VDDHRRLRATTIFGLYNYITSQKRDLNRCNIYISTILWVPGPPMLRDFQNLIPYPDPNLLLRPHEQIQDLKEENNTSSQGEAPISYKSHRCQRLCFSSSAASSLGGSDSTTSEPWEEKVKIYAVTR